MLPPLILVPRQESAVALRSKNGPAGADPGWSQMGVTVGGNCAGRRKSNRPSRPLDRQQHLPRWAAIKVVNTSCGDPLLRAASPGVEARALPFILSYRSALVIGDLI